MTEEIQIPQLRKNEHLKGLTYFKDGHYLQSLEIFKSAVKQFGEHIGLLCDISACYYMLEQFDYYETSILVIESNFSKNSFKLSNESQISTLIYLGKAFEELAQVSKALIAYEKALSIQTENLALHKRVFCQLLRLNSYLNRKTQLPNLYKKSVSFSHDPANIFSELEHAQLLAEIYLFNFEVSQSRLLKILNSEQIRNPQKRLCVIDFFEEHYVLNKNREFLFNMYEDFKKSDFLKSDNLLDYEIIILNFIQNKNYFLNITQVIELKSKMVLGSFLRIIVINCVRLQTFKNNENELQTLIDFLKFHISSLDNESKKIFIEKWESLFLSKAKSIEIYFDNHFLIREKKSLFIENDIHKVLIRKFIETDEVSIELIASDIFNENYNAQSLDKIRMMVTRLNKKIEAALLVSGFFKVSKSGVKLNSQILLKKSIFSLPKIS